MSVAILLWTILGYSLITSVLVLNFGRLSDMFGRVRLFTFGFIIFAVGSGLCTLSQTGLELVIFRLLQGVGAAFLFANSTAIITDSFPPTERGTALGINQVALVVGSVAGLVLGGVLTSLAGWRSIFLVNVPIAIVGVYLSYAVLHELAAVESGQSIDWPGNVSFAGGLATILVGTTLWALGALGAWALYGTLIVGAGLLLLFVRLESRVRHPMFDLSLFREPVFTASATAMFLNAIARGALVFTLVFYLQGPPHNLDPLTAGLYLVPVSVSLAALGPVSGWLSDRYGPRPFAILGLAVTGIGFLWLTQVGPTTTLVALLIPFILVGAGMGIFASPNRAANMNSVPPTRRGLASGVGSTLINTGVTVSLAVAIVIMSRATSLSDLQSVFLGLHPASFSGSTVPSFIAAVRLVFLVGAILSFVAVIPAAIGHRAVSYTHLTLPTICSV